jgi:hypothetical protein
MERKTAGEIADAVDFLEGYADWTTERSSEWARWSSVQAEMRKRDDLLRELEGAIGTVFFIAKDGPLREAGIHLQNRVREHLGIKNPVDSGSAGGGA